MIDFYFNELVANESFYIPLFLVLLIAVFIFSARTKAEKQGWIGTRDFDRIDSTSDPRRFNQIVLGAKAAEKILLLFAAGMLAYRFFI
jgi:hypothetical protein